MGETITSAKEKEGQEEGETQLYVPTPPPVRETITGDHTGIIRETIQETVQGTTSYGFRIRESTHRA